LIWTTPFLLVALLYLITDGTDIAKVPEQLVRHDGHVDGIEIGAFGDAAGDYSIDKTYLISDDPLVLDPIATKLLTEVTAQADLIEPVERPPSDLINVFVRDGRGDLERQRFGHDIDRVINFEEGRYNGLGQLG